MKKHNYYRFICPKDIELGPLKLNDQLNLDKKAAEMMHQLTKVLRIQQGDQIILIKENYDLPANTEYTFTVHSSSKQNIELILEKKFKISDVLDIELCLSLALPNKPGKLEEILMHCTELGATQFHLFKGDYSNFGHQLNETRLQKIIREAVEQSERARIPQLHLYKNIDSYLESLQRTCLVAMERKPLQENILEMTIDKGVDLLVGPEGGFSEREKELIKAYQLRTFTLGKQILRNETSAILAIGIISLKMQKP